MKNWALVLFAAAAVGAATVVVSVAVRRRQGEGSLEDISHMIDNCFDRVNRIEQELHRLRPGSEAAG